jgi:hypothetical protein
LLNRFTLTVTFLWTIIRQDYRCCRVRVWPPPPPPSAMMCMGIRLRWVLVFHIWKSVFSLCNSLWCWLSFLRVPCNFGTSFRKLLLEGAQFGLLLLNLSLKVSFVLCKILFDCDLLSLMLVFKCLKILLKLLSFTLELFLPGLLVLKRLWNVC